MVIATCWGMATHSVKVPNVGTEFGVVVTLIRLMLRAISKRSDNRVLASRSVCLGVHPQIACSWS